jgi:deoxyribodipyrimidine photo-lyase
MSQPISIFWFRRDLRLTDNAGLYHALQSGNPVLPVFIFDTDILDELEEKQDKRVYFIHSAVSGIHRKLKELGSTLYVLHSSPKEAFKRLVQECNISSVFTNHDYEPYATKRDREIAAFLNEKNITFTPSKTR